jgi:hypothetical protein
MSLTSISESSAAGMSAIDIEHEWMLAERRDPRSKGGRGRSCLQPEWRPCTNTDDVN